MTIYYRVGTSKLAWLSLCTFGIYGLYWSYRQWSAERAVSPTSFSPGFRAVFGVLTAHDLFTRIRSALIADGDDPSFSPGLLALAYFALAMAWRLPEPYSLIGLLWFVPVVPVQQAINANARRHDPDVDLNEDWEWWAFLLAAIGAVLLLLALIGSFMPPTAPVTP